MRRCLIPALLLLCAIAPAQDRRAIIQERARALAGFGGDRQVPEATPEIMKKAEQIAGGTVFFYGTTPVQVGLRNIDWRGGHIKHQEWPAQLNRFFHLRDLASAYRATREERFARAARAYIEDWLREDPYATATTMRPGDNGLNMSIRLGSSIDGGWGGTLPVFLPSPAFDDAFLDRVLTSISHQAGFLSQHLAPTGNFRISQLDTLVFTALRFPFLPNAPTLLKLGASGMQRALKTQFLADGAHVERTPGYADWMARVAANYWLLARQFPEADAAVETDIVARALDYGAHSELSGINDASAPHRDPATLSRLAVRAQILGRMGLTGKYPTVPPLAQAFPVAGQVFIRTEWKPGADYLAFDASTWGGGHGHLSRNSFVFRSGGRVLVADPAIISYEMSEPLAPYGKSTPAHSTLNLNGWNQSGADGQLLRHEFGRDAVLIQARYQAGYWENPYTWSFREGRGRGVYGDHERILLWVKGEYLLSLDTMTADARADIRNVWQMGPMEKWSHDPASLVWWSQNEGANLAVQLVAGPKAAMEAGSGWLGYDGVKPVPAPRVEFRYTSERPGPVMSAVLLAPFTGAKRPAYTVESAHLGRGTIHHIRLALPAGGFDDIAWSTGLALPVDDGRPFTTDAVFVWRRTNPSGAETKRMLVGGSYLQ